LVGWVEQREPSVALKKNAEFIETGLPGLLNLGRFLFKIIKQQSEIQ
jgi:hypothetical protein